MSIQFACACGQKLAAQEEHAGKRVRCTACGAVRTVPSDEPELPPTREPRAEFIRFPCSCGQVCQAKPEFAGRNTRCPRCSTVLTIPAGSIIAEAPAPRASSALQADEPVGRVSGRRPVHDEDDTDDGDDRPRRRRSVKKSKAWIWVAVAAGLLLVGGGIGLWLWLNSGISSDFQLVPRDAQFFVTVRVADAMDSPLGKKVADQLGGIPREAKDALADAEKKAGLSLKDIERVTFVMPDFEKPQVSWAIIHTAKAYDKDKIETLLSSPQEKEYEGKKYYLASGTAVHFHSRSVLVVGSEQGVKDCLDKAGKHKSGPLEGALEAASKKKYQVVLGVSLPPALMAKARKEAVGPKADKYKPLLELNGGYMAVAVANDIEWELGITFPDKDKARAAEKLTTELLDELKRELPRQKEAARAAFRQMGMEKQERFLDRLDKQLEVMKPKLDGKTLVSSGKLEGDGLPELVMALGGGLMLPSVQKVREAAARTQAQSNFRQIALAMHIYAEDHQGQLPPAVIRHPQTKQPLYSWRVALLPYLEQGDLYRRLKLDEPWNSPHNLPLLQRMPKVFQMPAKMAEPEGMTYIQVFTGPNTPFNGEQGPRFPASFPDGTSLTILIAEARRPVNWASPQDIVYNDRVSPRSFLGTSSGTGTVVGMADGSSRVVGLAVSDETLRRAINPADDLPLGPDW
jgi:hypothetical protein